MSESTATAATRQTPAAVKTPRNPLNSVRIETIAARAVGLIGVIFGLQTLPVMLAQAPALLTFWGPVVAIFFLVAIAALAISAILNKGVTVVMIGFALVFVFALAAWPGLVQFADLLYGNPPWLWYLCTVATAAAAIGMNLLWASVYTLLVPAIFAVIRAHSSGGGADAVLAVLDGVYAVVLGGVVLIVITMLRHAAAQVDRAQDTALDAYSTAVRQHATELERVQVDSIVHDSVLTTLLAAAGSRSPVEAKLAADMAAGAIARLDAAGAPLAPLGDTVALDRIVRRLRAAAQAFSAPIEVRSVGVKSQQLPVAAAEALYSATVQAMVNSLQHAGEEHHAVHRSVSIFGLGDEGCRIEIIDNGRGFDESTTDPDRLGLRVSIRERMHNIGGVVELRTQQGVGTALALVWPHREGPSR